MDVAASNQIQRRAGRYAIFEEIAAGGMATVHLARLAGPVGFSRVVAVKCLHPHLLRDPEFKASFIDEARLAARIRHHNVVPMLDVVENNDELLLVMEYVQGESLSYLRKAAKQQGEPIPPTVCAAIMMGVLHGLHAAHEARGESGEPLCIVHRDVSPQNILVGLDGVARVLDFGVAKAMQVRQETKPGTIKGKSAYMAPEQIRGQKLSRRADIFSASIVLWEILTGKRLFGGATEEERIYKVLNSKFPPPSVLGAGLPRALDTVVMRGLQANPEVRYQSALEMAEALEQVIHPASQRVVGDWVARIGRESLDRRAEILKRVEISKIVSSPPGSRPDVDGKLALEAKLSEFEHERRSLGGLTVRGNRSGPAPVWLKRRAPFALAASAALVLLMGSIVAWKRRAVTPVPLATNVVVAAVAAPPPAERVDVAPAAPKEVPIASLAPLNSAAPPVQVAQAQEPAPPLAASSAAHPVTSSTAPTAASVRSSPVQESSAVGKKSPVPAVETKAVRRAPTPRPVAPKNPGSGRTFRPTEL